MIIGSTIGGGIFTTAGDMVASGAHTGSVLIGWTICGIGMFCLMMCFFGLNRVRPDLTNRIYSYAKEGFGEFVGFNSAWGYWVSALLCNVSYTTLLFGAIGHFFPIFGDGNNLLSIVCASAIIWLLNALILRGVQGAPALNVITIAKLIPILLFVIAVIFFGAFRPAVLWRTFWGADTPGAPDISTQIKATTSATVWSFIGVEGAVVLSARAKHSAGRRQGLADRIPRHLRDLCARCHSQYGRTPYRRTRQPQKVRRWQVSCRRSSAPGAPLLSTLA